MQQESSKISTLIGIRGIAALWVALYYASVFFPNAFSGIFMTVSKKGYLGIDIYFILSGFILSYAYRNDVFKELNFQKIRDFLVRRLARVYPLHFITLFIMLLIYFIFSSQHYQFAYSSTQAFSMQNFVLNLLLLQSWGFVSGLSWNFPAWAISCEWFVYILFPIFTLLNRVLKTLVSNLVCIAIIWTGFFAICKYMDVQHLNPYGGLALMRVTYEFLIGMCIYNLYRLNTNKNVFWDWLSISSIVAIVGLSALNAYDLIILPVLGLLIYGLSRTGYFTSALFTNPVMVFSGEIAYSFYITHWIILFLLHTFLYVNQLRVFWFFMDIILLGTLVFSVGVAILLYKFVEKPMRVFIRTRVAHLDQSPTPTT